jgi:hypothetical protein
MCDLSCMTSSRPAAGTRSLSKARKFARSRSCSAPAGQWLASLSARVVVVKEAALAELRKYTDAAFAPNIFKVRGGGCGRGQSSYADAVEQQRQGGVHMQAAADQIARVSDLLAAYRCAQDVCMHCSLCNTACMACSSQHDNHMHSRAMPRAVR